MKIAIITGMMAGTILTAGCGKKSPSSPATPPPAQANATSSSPVAQPTNQPPFGPVGSIHFDDSKQIDAQGMLQIYMAMSGRQLVIDSRAAQIHTTIKSHVKFDEQFTHDEALKLIEKNLLEEAAIAITPIDDKRVSVTYNDALPTKH